MCSWEAFEIFIADDDSMQYLTNLLFDRHQFLVLNYHLYTDRETQLELEKSGSQGQAFLRVFKGLPYSVVRLLCVERLRPPAPSVV